MRWSSPGSHRAHARSRTASVVVSGSRSIRTGLPQILSLANTRRLAEWRTCGDHRPFEGAASTELKTAAGRPRLRWP